MNIRQIPASRHSYGGTRSLSSIKYIVIHYTGGTKDTAENEGIFFQKNNRRSAGAHFFVDQSGKIVQSVDMKRTAWSVGGFFTQRNGAGKYYKKCTNSNSVSIELCAIAKKAPSSAMLASAKELVGYIRRQCPNAKTIIRHWDVNGKSCPATMTGTNNRLWNDVRAVLDGAKTAPAKTTPATSTAKKPTTTTASGKAFNWTVTISDLRIRKGPGTNYAATGKYTGKGTFTITEQRDGWGRLKSGAGWISLSTKYGHAEGKAAVTSSKPKLKVDGICGTQTIKAWQWYLRVTADGIIGRNTIKAIQRWAGVKVDGIMGPNTRKAVQRKLGVKADGIWGKQTYMALQKFLNTH